MRGATVRRVVVFAVLFVGVLAAARWLGADFRPPDPLAAGPGQATEPPPAADAHVVTAGGGPAIGSGRGGRLVYTAEKMVAGKLVRYLDVPQNFEPGVPLLYKRNSEPSNTAAR